MSTSMVKDFDVIKGSVVLKDESSTTKNAHIISKRISLLNILVCRFNPQTHYVGFEVVSFWCFWSMFITMLAVDNV